MSRSASRSVLVVGGGPVGLATAIGLREFGVDCVLVERHASTLDFPKGRGVSVRSMEVFRQWGVEQELIDSGLPRNESLFAFSGTSLLGPEFSRQGQAPGDAPASPTDRLICAQTAMEEVLRDRATALGADLRFGTAMTTFTQDSDGVTAQLSDLATGSQTTLCADWLVAADGHGSTIRESLGIGRSGPGTVSTAVSILIGADLTGRMEGRTAVIYRISDLPGGSILAVDNLTRWLLIYGYDPAVESEASFTPGRCLELARRAVGADDVAVEVLGTRFWSSTALVADRYRAGHVLLAGDAAHITTPLGGLGMNCGIADAHNLTWKLAGVVQGWAPPSLLDTYEVERHPVAVATAQASLGAARPPAPTKGVDMGYCYDSAVIAGDGTPVPQVADPVGDYLPSGRPGCRAPHLWLDEAQAVSTLDLVGPHFTWLTDASADEIAELVDPTIPVRAHALLHDTWHELYGVPRGGAVLVRPDGHVAWRGASVPDGAVARDVLHAAVGRQASTT